MSSQSQSGLLHKYKGILFSTMSSEGLLDSLDSFDAREDDIFLVSYPKSGEFFFLKCTVRCKDVTITNRTIIFKITLFIRNFI